MRLYRHERRSRWAFEQRQQGAQELGGGGAPSGVLGRRVSGRRAAIASRVVGTTTLRAIPRDARRTHIALALPPSARRPTSSAALGGSIAGSGPATLGVLLYIGREVDAISGARKPLILTSALRDNRYQRVLLRVNANAARTYSIHTTGYAFDIARTYASSSRRPLRSSSCSTGSKPVNAIAYIRESGAIHVAVASDACPGELVPSPGSS